MYEDIIRFFANIAVQQQVIIEEMKGDVARLKESRIESVKHYAKEFEQEAKAAMEEAGITPPTEEEEAEKYQTISEILVNQQKDMEGMYENSKKIDTVDNRMHALRTENLILKNELVDLKRRNEELNKEAKERDRELQKMIKELREDVFFYRLKRKMRHISGKDK